MRRVKVMTKEHGRTQGQGAAAPLDHVYVRVPTNLTYMR